MTYESTWQRHKAKACWSTCFYCKQKKKGIREWNKDTIVRWFWISTGPHGQGTYHRGAKAVST